MALNFSELAQALNKVVHNSAEAIRKWVDLTIAPPRDVTIRYYNEQGNLVTETIPNYRKQLNTLLGDKKNLVFLDGGVITTEQELREFINNIPAKGYGVATIAGDIVLTRPLYIGGGKNIWLGVTSGRFIHKAYVNPDTEKTIIPKIHVEAYSYVHISVKSSGGIPPSPLFSVDFSGVDLTTNPLTDYLLNRILVGCVHSHIRIEYNDNSISSTTDTISFDVSQHSGIIPLMVARGLIHFTTTWIDPNGTLRHANIKLASSTQEVLRIITNGAFFLGTRLVDSAGNDLYVDANGNPIAVNWSNHVGGVLRDANGLPRNVIANHIL